MSPSDDPFEIPVVYEDETAMVVDKPSGVLVHPHPMDPHSPDCLDLVSRSTGHRVYAVHRLDRPASGLLVLCKKRELVEGYAKLFRERRVVKEYLAIVRGFVEGEDTVRHPVRRQVHGERVPAETSYRGLCCAEVPHPVGPYETARYTLVWLELHTGRSHQARKHMHHIAHPIVGDRRYGDTAHNRFFAEELGTRELYLRAWSLELVHPYRKVRLAIRAGLSPSWYATLSKLGIQPPAIYRERVAREEPAAGAGE
jgi:tRNA pseudouridine65 synthase